MVQIPAAAAHFDWNHARAFLMTAETGSFSAAARVLGVAQPTVGRQVAALEEELGVLLFERVGHALELTQAGLDLVEQIRKMNEAAARVALLAAGQSERIEGTVRLAASESVAAFVLPPLVKKLRERHPQIEIELVASNQSSDLKRREADIAVRHTRPKGEELVGKLIVESSMAHLYGAPSYLKAIGHPKSPEALAERAKVIGFDETDVLRKGLVGLGLPFRDDSFPLRTENHLVQWELAKAGAGLCMMMEVVGEKEPKVRRALPDFDAGFPFPTWLVSHRELRTSRRIRVVFDWLAEMLGEAMG